VAIADAAWIAQVQLVRNDLNQELANSNCLMRQLYWVSSSS
jgi:hypothetical protein